jgi:hypothetical protein
VNEYVLAAICRRDEAKTFGGVEELQSARNAHDGAFRETREQTSHEKAARSGPTAQS